MVHSDAPTGVWKTHRACYRFMADHLPERAHTLETGCGVSTVLFAAWGCDHVCVVPDAGQEEAVRDYCTQHGIDDSRLTFDLRSSDIALPSRLHDGELDLVFIDGCHGFPTAILDWYFAASRLRTGGCVVFDDTHLRQVSAGLLEYLEKDDRWKSLASTAKWRAFRRLGSGPLGEEWDEQRFMGPPVVPLRDRVASRLPRSAVKLLVEGRRVLAHRRR